MSEFYKNLRCWLMGDGEKYDAALKVLDGIRKSDTEEKAILEQINHLCPSRPIGGQVSDTGYIVSDTGCFRVLKAVDIDGRIIHWGYVM